MKYETSKKRLQELAGLAIANSKPLINESMVGNTLKDLLQKMETNTKMVADVLKVIKLAKEDK